MPLPPPEPLYEELCALRDAEDPTDPRHAHRWRIVSDWLASAFPGRNQDAEDARQEALISLVRNVGRMRAEGPLQAAKWVGTIVRRKRVDALRARKNDPVREGLRYESKKPDAPALLDRIACDGTPTLTPQMLESLVTSTLEHVHRALEEDVRSAAKRQLRRTQAQAALLRLVCGWDADAIVEALDYGEPIGKDRIYKWVERGRATVLRGLERWAATSEGEDLLIIDVLREIMEERRADAGRPRLERRKGGAEESP